MSLHKRLEDEVKTSLKEGNAVKVSVLRMVLSTVRMLMIEKNLKAIEDPDVIQILQKHIKQHKESIAQFGKGNRQDLVDKEQKELAILEIYSPKQLTEAELTGIIKDIVLETGFSSKADKGKLMKAVLDKVRGRADGKMVNDLVTGIVK